MTSSSLVHRRIHDLDEKNADKQAITSFFCHLVDESEKYKKQCVKSILISLIHLHLNNTLFFSRFRKLDRNAQEEKLKI